jgi:hypothetical protein
MLSYMQNFGRYDRLLINSPHLPLSSYEPYSPCSPGGPGGPLGPGSPEKHSAICINVSSVTFDAKLNITRYLIIIEW